MLDLLVKHVVCNRHVCSLHTQPGPALQPPQRLSSQNQGLQQTQHQDTLTWMRWTTTLHVPARKLQAPLDPAAYPYIHTSIPPRNNPDLVWYPRSSCKNGSSG